MPPAAPPRSLSGRFAALFAVLILYASLYPFEAWRWPPGRGATELLVLPWPPYRLPFDLAANFFGYLPLGLLVALAASGPGARRWTAVLLGAVLPAALSYAAEVAQHFLPGRHPSLVDWALNSAGAATGALIAPGLQAFGWPQRLQAAWQRWFDADAAGAVVLLLLWPVALLFPAPVALGIGQIGPRLQPLLAEALAGVGGAGPWSALWLPSAEPARLGFAAETLVTGLGLLAPCLLAFSVVAGGWRRVGLALGATVLTTALLTLSTALNYGPQHALAGFAPSTLPGLVLGLVAAIALAPLPRRAVAALGLVGLTALVTLVAQAPSDPYLEQSLQAWEQGRFIRFHGLAQWVGWLWPYAALGWLLRRVIARRG
ncbi:MAG: VanZ family protein [Rubrivivax sp.]